MLRKEDTDSIGRSEQTEQAIAEEVYKRAMQQAQKLLDQGFPLEGAIPVSRDECHER